MLSMSFPTHMPATGPLRIGLTPQIYKIQSYPPNFLTQNSTQKWTYTYFTNFGKEGWDFLTEGTEKVTKGTERLGLGLHRCYPRGISPV